MTRQLLLLSCCSALSIGLVDAGFLLDSRTSAACVSSEESGKRQYHGHGDNGRIRTRRRETSHLRLLMLTRDEAAKLLDENLYPAQRYAQRDALNRQDVMRPPQPTNEDNDDTGTTTTTSSSARILTADDPMLQFTYDEFPLASLDILLDAAAGAAIPDVDDEWRNNSNHANNKRTIVDLGSGCGRLCWYMALTRQEYAHIHGIEASAAMHQQAVEIQQQTVERRGEQQQPLLTFHCGMANDYAHILTECDIVFMYSTAFDNTGRVFVPAQDEQDDKSSIPTGGLILSDYWNDLLTQHCRPGTLVISTDRILDFYHDPSPQTSSSSSLSPPKPKWKLLRQMDVPNPTVLGSTCFIQQRL